MLIRDILRLKGSFVHSVAPETTVAAAVSVMVRQDIGSLVVLEAGAMTGLLTFREVLRAIDQRAGDLGAVTAREIMERDPVCARSEDSLDQARALMTAHHVRYLPVTDEGRLAGIISFHDLAKAALKESTSEIRLLKRYLEAVAPEQKASQ